MVFQHIYSLLLSKIGFSTKAFKSDPPHRYLYLVYEQPGPIVMLEGQQGCTEDRAMARIMDKEMLAAKYGLNLVAGNFLNSNGVDQAAEQLLCHFTRSNMAAIAVHCYQI